MLATLLLIASSLCAASDSDHEAAIEALLRELTREEKVRLLSGQDFWSLPAVDRLSIPSLVVSDGPTGLRSTNSDPATVFPVGVALGATWNPRVISEVGAAVAREALAYEVDVLLAPAINIQRTPLGGRNFETYSEDPVLAGDLGAAFISGVQSMGVAASVKHYVANNQEHERMRGSSNLDRRTLHEIYLQAFERAIAGGRPWTVMAAYNRINGTYATENPYLLEEVLKSRWGYDGVVLSDWGAVKSTVASARAGLDLEMPGPAVHYGERLLAAWDNAQVSPERIDEKVRRVLRLLFRVGLMDGNRKRAAAALNTPAHWRVAHRAAAESFVLLKNDNAALPLARTLERIAVIGGAADRPTIQGGGSSQVSPFRRSSPLEALRRRLGSAVEIVYAQAVDHEPHPPVIVERLLSTGAAPAEQGLLASYFSKERFEGRQVAGERDWRFQKLGFGRAAQAVDGLGFSVRWDGLFRPTKTGEHSFELSHSGVRASLHIGNESVIDEQTPSETELFLGIFPLDKRRNSLSLKAGRDYEMVLRYEQAAESPLAAVNLLSVNLRPPAEPYEEAMTAAESSDAAVVFVGAGTTSETEGRDRVSMRLSDAQNRLVREVAALNPRTIVVVNTGAPVEMPWIDEVEAVLQLWLPGQEGGEALADVLSGVLSPSGKLPVSFPARYEDNPTYLHYPGHENADYGEGLFVGYRYYDKSGVSPLFPFGHGLSYGRFALGDMQVQLEDTSIEEPSVTVSATLENTGRVAAAEVVQLYVSDKATRDATPVKQLRAFEKVHLEPGESRAIEFQLAARDFAHFSRADEDWRVSAGRYQILLGVSAQDIRLRHSLALGD